MRGGVVADGVPLRHHAPDQLGTGFDVVAYQKEGGGNLVLFQRIQNGGGVAVFKAGIKGDVQRFFAGIPHIVGAKWFEILR